MANIFDEVVKDYSSEKQTIEKVNIPEEYFGFEQGVVTKLKKHNKRAEFNDYSPIDLTFLKSRRTDGTPRFAVFSLRASKCVMEIWWGTPFKSKYKTFGDTLDFHSNNSFSSSLIQKQFKDITDKMANKLAKAVKHDPKKHHEISLTSEYDLAPIPDKTRAIIAKSKPLFNEVVIIAESSNWVEELNSHEIEVRMPPNPDPLVVGIYGQDAYLLDKYDTSTLEDYIAKEFTT